MINLKNIQLSRIAVIFTIFFLVACKEKIEVDFISHNGTIFSMDDNYNIYEAIAIKNGKILALGKNDQILNKYSSIETIDLKGLFAYPGFIDAHCHFLAYGLQQGMVDVSGANSFQETIELLKQSMTNLVTILRPEDLISVIKYSSNVSVVIDGLSGADKEKINERVAALRTSSSTAGGDAIQVAYRINRKKYSAEHNNIVIMITDGAFNKGSKTYLETIEKNYKERGILFSVVGIKTSEYVTTHMGNVVSKGGGSFIQVRTAEDARTKIIKEIKCNYY